MTSVTQRAVLENLNSMINLILSQIAKSVELQKKERNLIQVLCEELLINIIRYAYDETGDMTVEVAVDKETSMIYLCFIDGGKAFNPLEKEKPDITADIMERPIGGMGIFMVREIADTIVYERLGNLNKLTVSVSYEDGDNLQTKTGKSANKN
ncbi:MAG: ATP-binding protein [Lachnospiraceae bacterium]